MLAAHFRDPHQFSPHESRLIDICARQAADAISVHLLQHALRDADRRKDEFLAMLAHELRNPLTPIHNALQVLKRGTLPVREVERLHALIERQALHLTRLVDDLLDVARITRGKIELRREPLDLNEVIRKAVESAASLTEGKRQEVKVELFAEPLKVDGDVVRLTQVFANLLNNASKFTPSGGRIEISTKRAGDDVIATVSDNGAGFSPGSLSGAFELFNQGDHPSGQGQGGIGVGLALARGIVQLHGGTIDAFSDGKGKGSTFRIRLRPSEPDSKVADHRDEMRSEPKLANRVLIVDDQHDVADSLAMLVCSLGGEARAVYDSLSALASVVAFKPDLVIADIGLPDVDGCELARRIRKLPEGRKVVLVALSGWSRDETRQRAHEAGFDQFCIKPLAIEDLLKLCASLPVAG